MTNVESKDRTMSTLIRRMDKVIAQIGKLGRREAFAALQEAFGTVKERDTLAEAEIKRFFDLVTLVLLVYPRNMVIRISGAGQTAGIREEHLHFDDKYEVALERTISFLTRNFLDHLDEYTPLEYLRAALRSLAKEYGIERTHQNENVPVGDAMEPDETEDGTRIRSHEPVQEEAPQYLREYEAIRDVRPDGELFYDWYVGTLSRRELAQLHSLSEAQVEKAILRIAHEFEQGRLYPLVNWLIGLKEDGDILLLFSKGLTGEQIGQKVAKSHWLVYKRISSLRKRIGQMGDEGRGFVTRMCRAESA
jgi:hypothetical protein